MTVSQVNFQFSPSTVTVHKGDTIAVKNTAPGTPHTFTVQGTSIDVENDTQGQTSNVKIDLAPGSYPFMCRFHAAQGMKGTLVVK
jgi:plastocyanin